MLITTKRGGEIGTNNLSMQGQTDYDLGRKLDCTSVCNIEYISLSMEVHTFTQLLSMLLMTIPIVATHNPETSPEMVSSQLFPFIYKIENKICLRKAFPEVLTVLCPTMSLWCPYKLSVISKITLLNVSKITKFNIRVLITTKWLHQRFRCWIVGKKKSPKWSVLNINITKK